MTNNKDKEESPLVKGLKEYFENTPQEQLDKDFQELEVYNQIGTDALEYLDHAMNMLNSVQTETSKPNEDSN
jgi:hypothetical protein